MEKKVTYLVRYTDDKNKKHISFVSDMHSVKFLIDRFTQVTYEKSFKVTGEKSFFGID